ncbi:hypothetical protein VPH35_091578 [Triticum aestivum]
MSQVPQIGWFCSFVAATLAVSVMGQPPSPSNWFWETPPSWDGTPPQPEVPSYANGQLSPANYNKPNRIFICDDDWGKTCVAQCPDLCPKSCEMSCSYCETSCMNARWVSKLQDGLSVKRADTVNSVKVDLAGVFSISASAVPITDEDSKIHSYGKTMKDSLVHLDLRFKFHSLTDVVDGVLGQTYRLDYVNKMNVTAKMPIMGGAPKYLSSGLFSTDCAVSKFQRGGGGGNHVRALAA